MIELLKSADTSALLFLNGLNNAFFDELFWLISSKYAWIPMICALLFCTFRRNWRTGAMMIVAIALVITLCDQISSGIIKDAVCRLRPTHDSELAGLVHVVNNYRSGQYGFVSSHAANSFGVATFLALAFRERKFLWIIIGWAAILSYSRIYLGVHFPGDIICGGLLGCLLGAIVYMLYKRVWRIKALASVKQPNQGDARLLSYVTIGNLLLLLVIAVINYAVK